MTNIFIKTKAQQASNLEEKANQKALLVGFLESGREQTVSNS